MTNVGENEILPAQLIHAIATCSSHPAPHYETFLSRLHVYQLAPKRQRVSLSLDVQNYTTLV